jgi:superfamily I DNA and/or RNA helicase
MSSRRRKKFIDADVESHFVDMACWLAMESQAEVERMEERRRRQNETDAEKSGETILDLIVTEHVVGLGGHKLVTFERRRKDVPMPWHRLRVGAPVVVSSYPINGASESGVVSQKRSNSIQVALNRWPEAQAFRIDLTADEITRRRQLSAINEAKDAKGRLGKLRDLLLGQREPLFSDARLQLDFRSQLNEVQQQAVEFALSAEDLAIIHGPPGTGKTTTVVELIVQAVERGDRVFACAPSNTAVDNLLEKLILHRQKVVRLGHPARVSEQLRGYSLDGLVETHENADIVQDMRREADQLFRKADKWTRSKPGRGHRSELRKEAKQLLYGAKLLERQAIESVLDQADIVCATTTFNADLVGDRYFDLAVIDEACQSVEPGCWVPLKFCDRLVMAGDHKQLPPTVLSRKAADEGFAISLMERQIELWDDAVTRQLQVQYRMNETIMGFSSQQLYDGSLVADALVREHRLADLAGIEPTDFTRQVVTFIDSAGASWDEELEPEGLSKRNPNEAKLVLEQVDRLHEAGLGYKDIAVIAPYAAQVRLLRDQFHGSGLEIDTVDGFQGREKEAVVISLVRSNAINEIGFLADRRRMNVALTRARRKLIVIGDSATLGIDEFFSAFFDYVEAEGNYQTVWEFDL